MSAGRFVSLVLWAGALGLVVALIGGKDRVISIEIWMAGFFVWLGLSMLLHLLRVTPSMPRPLIGLMPLSLHQLARRRNHQIEPTLDDRPLARRSIDSLLIQCRHNDRVHALQLRPRLQRLAQHHLLVNHGIDAQREPRRMAEVLGPTAWMVDEGAPRRSPSPHEVVDFLERISPSTRTSTPKEHAT